MTAEEAAAFRFCCECPAAVILTLWPSGGACRSMAREYLEQCGATVVHERAVGLRRHAAELAVRALYHGEDWLESNCWYEEQPLPGGPPDGPHAGAKWKTALCFRTGGSKEGGKGADDDDFQLHVFVVDAENAPTLWNKKYSTRSKMARVSGNPGNSCMHITDSQATLPSSGAGSGYDCDASYAFACAKVLLHPSGVKFLNETCADPAMREAPHWTEFESWLSSREGQTAPFTPSGVGGDNGPT